MLTGAYLENVMVQIAEEDLKSMKKAMSEEIEKIVPSLVLVPCPLCFSKDVDTIVDTEGQGKLGQCKKCKVIYAYARPTLDVLNALYRYYIPSNLTDIPTRHSQLETRPRELNDDLDYIEKYLRLGPKRVIERGVLLDIGASSGDFLAYARVRGWKVEATELSELCADFMTNTLKIPVFFGNLQDIRFEMGKYKAITLRHSIEHLRNPIKELKVLKKALSHDGVLFISTPEHAMDLDLIKENHMLPLHLVNYTKETLEFLLSKVGFEMLDHESLRNHELPNMQAIAKKVDCK